VAGPQDSPKCNLARRWVCVVSRCAVVRFFHLVALSKQPCLACLRKPLASGPKAAPRTAGRAQGNSSDYEAVCGSTVVLLILPAAESRGGIFAFRFGFRRLFELPTLSSLPTAGIFLCVVSGVHPTGPRSLIRLTDLVDQLEFRAARGAKAEAEGKSYSRFKYRRFIKQPWERTS